MKKKKKKRCFQLPTDDARTSPEKPFRTSFRKEKAMNIFINNNETKSNSTSISTLSWENDLNTAYSVHKIGETTAHILKRKPIMF